MASYLHFHSNGSSSSRSVAQQLNAQLLPGQQQPCCWTNDSGNNSRSTATTCDWHDAHRDRVEIVLSEDDESKDGCTSPRRTRMALPEDAQDLERWDDSFVFDSLQPFEHIIEQLGRHHPRSPLSDSSDQSDYFQEPLSKHNGIIASSYTSYNHALLTPPTTTSATSFQSSKGTRSLVGDDRSGSSKQHTSKGSATASDSLVKTVARASCTSLLHTVHADNATTSKDKRDGGSITRGDGEQSAWTSPISSSSSSPRAVTASLGPPSTTTTSPDSLFSKVRGKVNDNDNDKDKDTAKAKDEDESLTFSAKSMTTITQEMMLSNLPAYTGIITRINPIKRVAAWVDDLEDLEVPEDDLDFSHVRSSLAKSSVPDALESFDNWESESEHSASHYDSSGNMLSEPFQPFTDTLSLIIASQPPMAAGELQQPLTDRSHDGGKDPRANVSPESEAIETLDDDFDLPADLGSLRLNLQARHLQRQQLPSSDNRTQEQPSAQLLHWQDAASDLDDFDFSTPLDNRSLSSSSTLR